MFSSQDGIQLETTTDTGGGQNVYYIDAFDSMTYVVDVPTTSNYLLSYRTASQAGSDPGFRVFIDNEYLQIYSQFHQPVVGRVGKHSKVVLSALALAHML